MIVLLSDALAYSGMGKKLIKNRNWSYVPQMIKNCKNGLQLEFG